jgi:hypothetical protein
MNRPRARASNTHDFLDFVEEVLRPGVRAHLRQALAPEIATALLDALPTEWLDVADVHGAYVTELVRLLGPAEATSAWRRYVVERLEARPAYRALIQGAIRLFGLSLGSFVQLMPKIFAQTFRDCFEIRTQVEGREAFIHLELSPTLARFDGYTQMLHGLLLAVCDYSRDPGATMEFEPDLPGRRITAHYRW